MLDYLFKEKNQREELKMLDSTSAGIFLYVLNSTSPLFLPKCPSCFLYPKGLTGTPVIEYSGWLFIALFPLQPWKDVLYFNDLPLWQSLLCDFTSWAQRSCFYWRDANHSQTSGRDSIQQCKFWHRNWEFVSLWWSLTLVYTMSSSFNFLTAPKNTLYKKGRKDL